MLKFISKIWTFIRTLLGKRKRFILIDMDEVIFDFDAAVAESWPRYLPNVPRIDSNQLELWELPLNYPEEHRKTIMSIWREQGFFRKLKPIEGAVEAIHEMMDEGHMVSICTTPTTQEPYCMYEKLQSIYEYFGERLINEVYFSKDKTRIKGDYLIDDRPKITGKQKPDWTHIHFDRGRKWGKGVNGPQLSDWSKWREVIK